MDDQLLGMYVVDGEWFKEKAAAIQEAERKARKAMNETGDAPWSMPVLQCVSVVTLDIRSKAEHL